MRLLFVLSSLSFFSSLYLSDFLVIHSSSGRFTSPVTFMLVLLLRFSGGYASMHDLPVEYLVCLVLAGLVPDQ